MSEGKGLTKGEGHGDELNCHQNFCNLMAIARTAWGLHIDGWRTLRRRISILFTPFRRTWGNTTVSNARRGAARRWYHHVGRPSWDLHLKISLRTPPNFDERLPLTPPKLHPHRLRLVWTLKYPLKVAFSLPKACHDKMRTFKSDQHGYLLLLKVEAGASSSPRTWRFYLDFTQLCHLSQMYRAWISFWEDIVSKSCLQITLTAFESKRR